jgi:D-alanyl-D-alanine carboxypeptidase
MKMTQTVRFFALAIALACCMVLSNDVFAQSEATFEQRVQKVMERPEFAHSRFGIGFYSMETGKAVYTLNPQQFFVPGSTTKLLTMGTPGRDL